MGKEKTLDRFLLVGRVDHTYVHNPVNYVIVIRQMLGREALMKWGILSLWVPSVYPHAGDMRLTRAGARAEKLSTVLWGRELTM